MQRFIHVKKSGINFSDAKRAELLYLKSCKAHTSANFFSCLNLKLVLRKS